MPLAMFVLQSNSQVLLFLWWCFGDGFGVFGIVYMYLLFEIVFGFARWCVCGRWDLFAGGTFSTKSNRCQLPLGFLREAVLFKSAKRGERLRNQATGKSFCASLSWNPKSHLLSGAWVKLDHKTQFPGWSNWDDVGVGSNVFSNGRRSWSEIQLRVMRPLHPVRKVRKQLLGDESLMVSISPEGDLQQASGWHHFSSLLQEALVDKHKARSTLLIFAYLADRDWALLLLCHSYSSSLIDPIDVSLGRSSVELLLLQSALSKCSLIV